MSKYLIISILFLFLVRVLISKAMGTELYSNPILLARTGDSNAFNLPVGASLENVTPQVNDRLDVAFKIYLGQNSNQQAVWSILGRSEENNLDITRGQLIAMAPEGQIISDVDLNNKGEMVFTFFNEEGSEGLYYYNEISRLKKILDYKDLDARFFSSTKINDDSQIYFKGIKFDDQPSSFFHLDTKQNNRPVEIVTEGAGISYLFTLGLQDEGPGLAFKARLGATGEISEAMPDQIIRYVPGGLFVVAVDRDANLASPFLSFSNGVVAGPVQTVVFVAQTEKGQGIYVHHPRHGLIQLIFEGESDLKSIAQFTPVVRAQGNIFEVFFRGVNAAGFEVVYFLQYDFVTKQNTLLPLVIQNQKIKTETTNTTIQFFSGGLGLNNLGDLVVHTVFASNQEGILLLNRLQE